MKTVHKFDLPRNHGAASIDMPQGAEALSVGFQIDRDGEPRLRLWALVDDTAEKSPREFMVCVTGGPLPKGDWWLIGRATAADSAYVVHVLESKT